MHDEDLIEVYKEEGLAAAKAHLTKELCKEYAASGEDIDKKHI